MTHGKIPELRDISYERRIKEYGLTTLGKKQLRGDQICCFGTELVLTSDFVSIRSELVVATSRGGALLHFR